MANALNSALQKVSNPFTAIAQQQKAAADAEKAALDEKAKGMDERQKGIDAARGELLAVQKTAPKANLPDAPVRQFHEMSGPQAMLLMAVSLLAGRASSQPLAAAAKAMGAATKAYHQKQVDAYDAAVKDYDLHMKRAEKQYELDRKAFDDAVAGAQGNVEALRQNLEDYIVRAQIPIDKAQRDQMSAQEMMGLVKEQLQQQQNAIRNKIDVARLGQEGERIKLERERLTHMGDYHKEMLAAMYRETNIKEQKFLSQYQGVPQDFLKEQFGWQKTPTIDPKEAKQLADQVMAVRFMDQIDRSLSENPGLARKVNQIAAKASGSLDNFFSIAQSTDDAEVLAFQKSLLNLTRAGALKLSGDRGPTVTGDRIANQLLTQSATPESLKQVARNFGRDFISSIPKEISGNSVDWSQVQSMPTFSEVSKDPTPLIGGGQAPATAPSADPLEGRTATGPNGQKMVRRNGQWLPM